MLGIVLSRSLIQSIFQATLSVIAERMGCHVLSCCVASLSIRFLPTVRSLSNKMKNPNHLQIPFRPQFKEVLLSGAKTMTSRTKQYGHVGSRFWAFSQCFEITEIRKLRV